MTNLVGFADFIVHGLLNVLIWLVIISAVMSWLVAFGVINIRNRVGNDIVHTLQRATDPLLRPIRRFIPTLGGMDFSPVIFILLVQGIDIFLRPLLFGWIGQMVQPGVPL
jgi:YggT family protein